MNSIAFCKMHGLGNDFVVIDGISQSVDINNIPIVTLAHRHIGIGFDQLLLILPSTQADFSCLIFNADGSEAEQCGNGMRCVARYIHENGLSENKSLRIETKAGIISAVIHDYDVIEINMGVPQFFSPDNKLLSLTFDDKTSLQFAALSMGNPHAIVRVDAVQNTPVAKWGAEIAKHKDIFPDGVNVGFIEVINPQRIRLRTFERGVGETLACGSNACAAVAAGIKYFGLASTVEVALELGQLRVEWARDTQSLFMTGPTNKVFIGKIT